MKIGIYLTKISRELGGGARFQEQVINGLLESPTDNHEFCLIGHEVETPFGQPQILKQKMIGKSIL